MKVMIEVQEYEDDKNENKVKKIEKMEGKGCRFSVRVSVKRKWKSFYR